jgi:hypothetical protein
MRTLLHQTVATVSAWAAFAVHATGRTDGELATAFARHSGPGTPHRLSGGGILTPAKSARQALWLALKAREDLGDTVWISVAWRSHEELAGGVREVEDVLKVVRALRRPPGVYRLDDVAVEYAVASSPEASRHLAELIEPVVEQPELLKTLEALIAADGNRARAASELIIHRSTIDYRLRRIECLTGHSPTRVRGLQTLCTALAARAMAMPRLPRHPPDRARPRPEL